jgi:hypothetical protein
MNIRKETFAPPLVRRSGTFSHREKAWRLDVVRRRRRHRETSPSGRASLGLRPTAVNEDSLESYNPLSAEDSRATLPTRSPSFSGRGDGVRGCSEHQVQFRPHGRNERGVVRRRSSGGGNQRGPRSRARCAPMPISIAGDALTLRQPQRSTSNSPSPRPFPGGRIRTNLRVQRSTAVFCRGSGSRRLAGGHALAGRTCSQLRPPEGDGTNIVPRQPARGNAERPRLSALSRACLAPTASTRIRPVAHPRAGVAARYFVRCVPGVNFASTFDLRARDPRLTSYCRCRGNALRSSLALKLVRMPGGRGRSGVVACNGIFYVEQLARALTTPSLSRQERVARSAG